MWGGGAGQGGCRRYAAIARCHNKQRQQRQQSTVMQTNVSVSVAVSVSLAVFVCMCVCVQLSTNRCWLRRFIGFWLCSLWAKLVAYLPPCNNNNNHSHHMYLPDVSAVEYLPDTYASREYNAQADY